MPTGSLNGADLYYEARGAAGAPGMDRAKIDGEELADGDAGAGGPLARGAGARGASGPAHGGGRGAPRRDRDRVVLAAFLAEALLAGGNGVAIRFSNRELAPLWGAGLRFLLAAGLLAVGMAALRVALPRGRALGSAVRFGLLQFAGAFGLYYAALVHLHAGPGQTLLALVPLAALLLAAAQGQERVRGAALVGALLGLAGVGVLSRESLGAAVPPLAVLAVLGSVLCFAEALVVVRRAPPLHPVALNAVGMAAGAVVLVGASVGAGEPTALPQRAATWLALGYAATLGSVGVFLLHVYVVQRWTASRAAYVMVLIPVVTVGLSAWLDAEPVSGGLVLGGLLVLAGVYVGALRAAGAAPRRSTAAADRAPLPGVLPPRVGATDPLPHRRSVRDDRDDD